MSLYRLRQVNAHITSGINYLQLIYYREWARVILVKARALGGSGHGALKVHFRI
jgi:hypothetical protein